MLWRALDEQCVALQANLKHVASSDLRLNRHPNCPHAVFAAIGEASAKQARSAASVR
jgi:hypothetical protein